MTLYLKDFDIRHFLTLELLGPEIIIALSLENYSRYSVTLHAGSQVSDHLLVFNVLLTL